MLPTLAHRLLTRRVGMGNALIVGLLKGCIDHGCEIVAEARARRLERKEHGTPCRHDGGMVEEAA